MKYLIVNADDFGMTKGINAGIVQAMAEGIVTDTSLIACGGAFDDAVRLARANGIRRIGAHLSLTEVPPLVLRRRIKNYSVLALKLLSGAVSLEEARSELKCQLDRIRGEGFEITHLDSHENIHILPGLRGIFVDLAVEYKIPAIRLLRENGMHGAPRAGKFYRLFISRYFSGKSEKDLKAAGLFSPDRLLGFLDSGRLSEALLIDMLNSLEEGVTELAAHPGFLSPELIDSYRWHINCEDELYALTSPKARRVIEDNRIKLVSYSHFL